MLLVHGAPRIVTRRLDGALIALRPDRARCRRCAVTQVLLPVWCVPRRGYGVEVVGAALLAAAEGAGHRRAAACVHAPAGTGAAAMTRSAAPSWGARWPRSCSSPWSVRRPGSMSCCRSELPDRAVARGLTLRRGRGAFTVASLEILTAPDCSVTTAPRTAANLLHRSRFPMFPMAGASGPDLRLHYGRQRPIWLNVISVERVPSN